MMCDKCKEKSKQIKNLKRKITRLNQRRERARENLNKALGNFAKDMVETLRYGEALPSWVKKMKPTRPSLGEAIRGV